MTERRRLTTRPAPTTLADHPFDDAACIGYEAVFDATIDGPNDHVAEAEAKAIRAGCAMVQLCLERNLGEEWGVWGGKSADERKGKRHDAVRDEGNLACRACPFKAVTQRGLSNHWARQHALAVGECIRGHEYTGGTCQTCRMGNYAANEADRRRERALAREAS